MASAKDIAKKLTAITGGNDETATVHQFLDTGYPPFNQALSAKWDGGFGGGRMVEIAGPPSSGKTAIATAVMAAAQAQGGIAGFHDHERSFSITLAQKLGINADALIYKKPRTFEESLDMCITYAQKIRAAGIIDPKAPIAWVFDSLAAMVPQSALIDAKSGKDKALTERSMHDNTALARATSASFPAFAQLCEEENILAVFLNQIRMKIGVLYGDPRTTPGGQAPEFYFSTRVMLNTAAKITVGKTKDVIGMQINATVIKNKVARPFQTASWRFMFQPDGTGKFDVERSLIEFLEEQKILKTARPGYVDWKGKTMHKEALARDIERDGARKELIDLLPAAYEPPVVAEVAEDTEAA